MDYTAVILNSELHYKQLTQVPEPVERGFTVIRKDLRLNDRQPNLNPREADCLNQDTGCVVTTENERSKQ